MLIPEQIALLLETGEGGSCVQGSYCGRKLNLHRSTSGGRINISYLSLSTESPTKRIIKLLRDIIGSCYSPDDDVEI